MEKALRSAPGLNEELCDIVRIIRRLFGNGEKFSFSGVRALGEIVCDKHSFIMEITLAANPINCTLFQRVLFSDPDIFMSNCESFSRHTQQRINTFFFFFCFVT